MKDVFLFLSYLAYINCGNNTSNLFIKNIVSYDLKVYLEETPDKYHCQQVSLSSLLLLLTLQLQPAING